MFETNVSSLIKLQKLADKCVQAWSFRWWMILRVVRRLDGGHTEIRKREEILRRLVINQRHVRKTPALFCAFDVVEV